MQGLRTPVMPISQYTIQEIRIPWCLPGGRSCPEMVVPVFFAEKNE